MPNCNDIPTGLQERTEAKEGFSGDPYKDTLGVLTFGFGTTFPITKEEARAVLCIRLRDSVKDMLKMFPDLWSFGNARAMAIIDMRYNLGLAGFKQFKRMVACIYELDWEHAADEAMRSDWYKQVKTRAVEDVHMLRTGEMYVK